MKYDDLLHHLEDAKNSLTQELAQIRTGRANSIMVETIMVNAYTGSEPLPIKELATIAIPDAQSILITPWDSSVLSKIEDAIIKSQKGFNPINEGKDIRVPIPMLTEERRKTFAKEIGEEVENAKIRIRNIRQDVMKSVEEQEDNGVISEDEMYRQKKLIEEAISKTNKELEEIGRLKSEEVMQL
jgi:ribosome recycling factor